MEGLLRQWLFLGDPKGCAGVKEQRNVHTYLRSPHARSPHSGSAGSVRSTPSGIVTVPFIQPISGWRPDFSAGSIFGVPACLSRRNTSLRAAISTCSLRKPASSQARVITLFVGELLHHA